MSDRTVSESQIVAAVRRAGAVAVLRLPEHTQAVRIGRLLLDAGLPVMEVTFDHPGALAALRSMVDQLPADALVGAGAVRSTDQVAQCRDAGGRFCVSPHTDPGLIHACIDAGLEPVPGAHTATEVAAASDAGARLIKLFPAGPLGQATFGRCSARSGRAVRTHRRDPPRRGGHLVAGGRGGGRSRLGLGAGRSERDRA
jgi:Entner-Doudoroff aldolase